MARHVTLCRLHCAADRRTVAIQALECHFACAKVRFHQEVLRLEPLVGKQDNSGSNWSVRPASEVSEADLESVALPG